VKEETLPAAADVRAIGAALPLRAVLRRAAVPGVFVAMALLVATGYGNGVQLNDGQASLHIDPIKFLSQLLHAWSPALHLGVHTGFWFPYETPYAWSYGLAQILHIPQDFAQHAIVFGVYLGCLYSMYYCLGRTVPWLDEPARVAGACVYLFNMYVALNSQAQIVWLLTYATLPAMIGVTASALHGQMNFWRAGLFIALLVLVGGGINPPLVAINAIVLAIFVIVAIAFDSQPTVAARRAWPFVVIACAATIAINLYWLMPFVDFFRGVYLNGVLSEAPSMHNAATSFANVLRGLGHWATFVSFNGKPYFPWAASYAAGLFGALLWFVPIVALGGVAFKRNQRPATLFFLLVTIVSVPLVVGYYHDALGDAVTAPVYNVLYRDVPGFQMFRFSYKWVAGVEFGIAGLYAIAAFAIAARTREWLARATPAQRESLAWIVPASGAALVLIPIFAFVPVLINKMNYPGPVLPAWEYREKSLVGDDQRHRVALFPTQYLEQFDWGAPQFYIEDSLIDRPMIYGLLGSAPSEGTDVWVRRAYRAAREGLPFAADMLRVLGVDTILQRDDFIPVIDFSSPGESRFNTTTLTHDLLHRVVGASPARSEGPLRVYHVNGSLPLIYGVTHPLISTMPTFSEGYLGDVGAMAKGQAEFDPPSRSVDEFFSSIRMMSPIVPASAEQIRDLAVKEALQHGAIRIHPPSADVGWTTPFSVREGGIYEVFAREQSLLFQKSPAQNLDVDGTYLSPLTTGSAWTYYGRVELSPGGGHLVSDGYPDANLDVALVNVDDLKTWQDQIAAMVRGMPQNQATFKLVYDRKTSITLPASGKYRVSAAGVVSVGPDGQVRAHWLPRGSYRGSFPLALSNVLPYIVDAGVAATSAVMMPAQWYRDDPSAYGWQRGDPVSWLLFARDAHVRVFVPGSQRISARGTIRISRLQVGNTMSVSVNGLHQANVSIAGPAASPQAYDTPSKLDGPTPVPLNFTLTLAPGWNDLDFRFSPLQGERTDLGNAVISAAVAPDLTFVRTGSTTGSQAVVRNNAFNLRALAIPPSGVIGDPEIAGTIEGVDGRAVSLAVALSDHGSVAYRAYPISQDGGFDINFMHAFPNGWYDGSQRIVGLWFISRNSHARF
jgi:hypothetical protein